MIFGIKRKIANFDPHNVFLGIVTNIPQRLKTGFVLQAHIWSCRICALLVLINSQYVHNRHALYNEKTFPKVMKKICSLKGYLRNQLWFFYGISSKHPF